MKLFHSKQVLSHVRFIIIVIFSIFLIIYDYHFDYIKNIRRIIEEYINSFYFITNKLQDALNNIADFITNKNQLILENKILKKEIFLQKSKNLLLKHLQEENNKLYSLLKLAKKEKKEKIIAKVISNNNSIYHDQIIIDKGIKHGIYDGQVVINDKTIIGQVILTNKTTSRILLLCDINHALPIKLLRNNASGIALGTGCNNDLKINFLNNIDVNIGDIIVTSGLGGKYPPGYQIALISKIEYNLKNKNSTFYAKHFINYKELDYILLYQMH
uniref:Cell shape-determining protein MreC n=1 Tax=Candidatus Aschnera chinzeii TaxID=1485666 RepID=A0AAT9G3W3_9ENTR|nr:MAG: hypothetical protein ACHINZ_0700 [Candidatus Aschnera chinzeii]